MTNHPNDSRVLPLAQAYTIASNHSGLPVSLKTVYRWLAQDPSDRPESLRRLGMRLIVNPNDLQIWLESRSKEAYPK